MGGNNGAVQSSTTKSEPWTELQQPIKDVLGNAQSLYSQNYIPYEGQQVAGPSDSTIAGYGVGYQRATLGAPDLNSARGSMTDMVNGSYLNSNPYVQQNSDYTRQVMQDNANNMAQGFATGGAANNAAAFARQGAYGGSAYDQKQRMDEAALAQQIGQAGNQYNMQRSALGAQDYQQGQQNMLGASSQIQGLSQDDWKSADYLRSMGAQQEGYQQQLLDSQKSSFDAAMQAPYNQMQSYANLLSQFAGTGSTGSTTMYGGGQSNLGLGVGAGLLGLAGYNMIPKG